MRLKVLTRSRPIADWLGNQWSIAIFVLKAVIRQENDLVEQLKSWYDMESYGSMKNVDSRSAADRQANDILEQTTILKDGRYHVGMLWADDDPELSNNFFPH